MTSKSAPVSVVIPCYDCRTSIERAVVSVTTQTLLPCEIILVHDATPDGGETFVELQRIANKYKSTVHIKIVQLPRNMGPGSARNYGWEVASSPLIAFLDADDSWCRSKIEVQYCWMRDHPEFDLSCHNDVQLLDENEQGRTDLPMTGEVVHTEISSGYLIFFNMVATRTVMLRRDLPFRFQHEKRYAEDYLLWLQIVFRGHAAAKIEMSLANTFKSRYGQSGLSANLWKMELGELECYRVLYRAGQISIFLAVAASSFSLIKFARRLIFFLWSCRHVRSVKR